MPRLLVPLPYSLAPVPSLVLSCPLVVWVLHLASVACAMCYVANVLKVDVLGGQAPPPIFPDGSVLCGLVLLVLIIIDE